MLEIDPKIIEFIHEHHVLTIASCMDNKPWCASCFYVYLEQENLFVFTSEPETRHGKEFIKNQNVAGNILLETSIVNKIQGLQFSGSIKKLEGDLLKTAGRKYLKKFPVAILMNTELWGVEPDYLKMTHNRLGFGKKLIWSRSVRNEIKGK